MTDKELMEQALEALELAYSGADAITVHGKAITAIREALAQQKPEQEPVAWGIANTRPTESKPLMMVMLDEPPPSHLVIPLYTTPQQRQWQGLTLAEFDEIHDRSETLHEAMVDVVKTLREKNT